MGQREFRFGDWQVDVEGNTLSDGATRIPLEPRAMEVLRYLCRHPGAVIPAEELLQACWGSAEFGDNPVHKAITQLRRALGDSSTDPRYIETIRKRGYRAIAQVIEAEADEQVAWTNGSPFRGLEPFQENHAAIFFGRVEATARLKELVEKQTLAGQAMALVLGPSGSGKTSLVRAGLMPQLMHFAADEHSPVSLDCTLYLDCADFGEISIFHALAAVLIDAEIGNSPLFLGESASSLGEKLEYADLNNILPSLSNHKRPSVGIFVDRLEAIFLAKGIDENIRSRFISVLEVLSTTKNIVVIMACRNDFYPDIIALPQLAALKSRGGHFDLTAPDGADIAQIVRLPAKAAQLSYEIDPTNGASLDDVLCDAARGSPDTLPLLQYCLNELYRQRTEGGTLRFDVFRQLGGIEGAIGIRAEQIITSLTPGQAAALPQILSLLVKIGDEQTVVTARSVAWSMLRNEEERDLVKAMVEARLFVSELAGEVPSFGVAHEALLRRWPRVVEWIHNHKDTLQLRTRLVGQAERWIAKGRPKDLLLPKGSQINQAILLIKKQSFLLSEHQKEFIHTSASRAKLSDRLKITVLAILASLSLLVGVLGLKARAAQHEAELHKNEAENLLVFMLGEFVDKLRPLGRLDMLDSISSRALSYLSKNSSSAANQIELSQRAKALHVIAEVNIARSKIPEAIEALMASRKILLHQLSNNPSDKNLPKDLGANSFWLGKIYFERKDFPNAISYFSEYKLYSEKLISVNPDNTDGYIELSYATNSLGSTFLQINDFQNASINFETSMKLKSEALKKNPGDDTLIIAYANSLSWLASTKARLGLLQEAINLYEKEENLLRPFQSKKSSNTLAIQRLAFALTNQAEIYLAIGNQNKAKDFFGESKSLLKTLTLIDSTNRAWQANYFATWLSLERASMHQASLGKLETAKTLYNNLEALSQLDPKKEELIRHSTKSLTHKANINLALNKIDDAENDISQAIEKLNKINKPARGDARILAIQAEALLLKAEIQRAARQHKEYQNSCKAVQAILTPTIETTTDYFLLAPFVRSHACTGTIEKAKSQQMKLERISYREPSYFNYISTHLKN